MIDLLRTSCHWMTLLDLSAHSMRWRHDAASWRAVKMQAERLGQLSAQGKRASPAAGAVCLCQ
jgi:hypothetical protein